MWIKTFKGTLLNADLAETIEYDSKDDVTRAWIDERKCEISPGDVVPIIMTAIMNGKTFVGVQ